MECPFSEHVGIRWNKTAAGSVSLFEALRKAQDEAGQMTRSSASSMSRIKGVQRTKHEY
jgi:hypothetical protein